MTDFQNQKQEKSPVYINPMTDFGIKRIFYMTRRGPERLTSFLRAFLPDVMKDVVNITYKPTELLGEAESEKKVLFDIYCVTDNGKHFVVEMQRAKQSFFTDRIITYDSRVVSSEVERGDTEYRIPTVICFSILDYNSDMLAHSEKAFHVGKVRDEEQMIISEKKVFCFLELSKFAAQNIGQLKDINFLDDSQKWAFSLKNMHRMEEQDLSGEDEIFQQLFEDCRLSKLKTMEKKEYKKSLMDYYDVRDAVNVAREDGRKEGRVEEKHLLARNMLAKGLEPTLVAEISGLTEDEVMALMVVNG